MSAKATVYDIANYDRRRPRSRWTSPPSRLNRRRECPTRGLPRLQPDPPCEIDGAGQSGISRVAPNRTGFRGLFAGVSQND